MDKQIKEALSKEITNTGHLLFSFLLEKEGFGSEADIHSVVQTYKRALDLNPENSEARESLNRAYELRNTECWTLKLNTDSCTALEQAKKPKHEDFIQSIFMLVSNTNGAMIEELICRADSRYNTPQEFTCINKAIEQLKQTNSDLLDVTNAIRKADPSFQVIESVRMADA